MPIDPDKRQALIDLCNAYAEAHDSELPAVTIEQFFDGNDDLGSILCNLSPSSTQKVREQLEAIRSRADVQEVLIRIYETMEEDDDCWPFAEQVIIITTAGPKDVRSWFKPNLAPDEVWELEDEIHGVPQPKPGAQALVAWWD